MKAVWQTIKQFHMLEEGDRVLLGVSGGSDSIALLHLLDMRKEQYGIQLFVVHVNHKLRAEAEKEAVYVEQVCRQREIPYRLYEKDVAAYAGLHGMSLEQAGHEVRHNCFQEAAEEWNITKLALGHHADDRAESVILHLVQGCGLDGLTAMPPKDGWLIRPLAQVKKQDIIRYCEQNELHYFTDSTNLEPGCLRNRIRLIILPELQKDNPQITDALMRLQENCTADADYLHECIEILWKQHGFEKKGSVCFPADILHNEHIAMQRRILRYLYCRLTGSETNLTFRQTEQMRKIAMQNQGSQEMHLAGGVCFTRQYNLLCMRKEQKQPEAYCYSWNLFEILNIYEAECVLEAKAIEPTAYPVTLEPNLYEIYLDADRLLMPLAVRSRNSGDRLRLPCGHKKLKNFFIDKKIPAKERNRIPLVVSGEEIIWIPGYYIAECVRITSETRRIYRLSCNSSMFS